MIVQNLHILQLCHKETYEILSSCNSVAEDSGLLGYYTVLLGTRFLTFQRTVVPYLLGQAIEEDEGTTTFKTRGTTCLMKQRNISTDLNLQKFTDTQFLARFSMWHFYILPRFGPR